MITCRTFAGMKVALLLCAGWLLNYGTAQGVEIANIDVQQLATDNEPASIVLTLPQSSANFFLRTGSNRGDYNIQIGADHTDDHAGGILISSIRQNNNLNELVGFEGIPTVRYATSAIAVSGGGYNIPIFTTGNVSGQGGEEYNSHLAAAYFSYADGWLGGVASNSANGTELITFVGHPSLSIGSNFIDTNSSGQYQLYLPGVNTKSDGFLFVVGAKNEDNYALSRPAADGSHFVLQTHDNGTDGGSGERDPVGFVYVPLGTEGVTMGRVFGSTGSVILGQGDYVVRNVSAGQFHLTIAGQTPETGVLILTPEGMQGNNVDNIITYEASGSGWLIQSRDLPNAGLQSYTATEGGFNFLFVPLNNIPAGPGSLAPLLANATAVGNITVDDFTGGNDNGNMAARITMNRQRLGIYAQNKADISLAQGGAEINPDAGVLLASVRQHLRTNVTQEGYGIAAVYTADTPNRFIVATSLASSGAEFNVDFAVAYFPTSAGFKQGRLTPGSIGITTLALDSVGDTRTQGVLMTIGEGNFSVFTSNSATADGTGWDVNVRSSDGSYRGDSTYSYVYLPYNTAGLVAGRVNADGSILNSTEPSGFTIVREDTGLYRLTIVGETPDTGTLLLNSFADFQSGDNFLVYREDNGDFLIGGLQAGSSPFAEDTSFSFAFISADNPLDAFTTSVPEPASIALAIIGIVLLGVYRRSHRAGKANIR